MDVAMEPNVKLRYYGIINAEVVSMNLDRQPTWNESLTNSMRRNTTEHFNIIMLIFM